MDKNPGFALEVGLAALRWLGERYGDEVSPRLTFGRRTRTR